MKTQYVLQKLNSNKYRRFIAEMLGEHGGTTSALSKAKTWETEAAAEWFRTKHSLSAFAVVLSDGTDDVQEEARKYWNERNSK